MICDNPGPPKRLRILRVSGELLRRALHLPEGTRIVDVSKHLFFTTDEFAFKVENPEFTPIYDTQPVPEITPLLGEQRVVKFLGWQS